MYKYNYKYELKIANPTVNCPHDYNLLSESFSKGVEIFNTRFLNRKKVEVVSIELQRIILNLTINTIPNNPTRELSPLSQILISDFGFKGYSSKTGRLFNINIISEPAVKKSNTVNDIVENITEDGLFIQMSTKVLITNNRTLLNNYIAQLENLLNIAKAKDDIIAREEVLNQLEASEK